MQLVLYNVAGSVWTNLPQRPDASGLTFDVLNPQGGNVLAAQTPTVESVDTTLSGAMTAGATSCTVTSATGITVGRSYLIGGSEDTGGERLTVKGVSGTTVSFFRPCRLAQASGAAFQSTRLDMALTAASVGVIGRFYHCDVTWKLSTALQPTWVVPFDVVRYAAKSGVTFDDIAAGDPIIAKRLAAGFVWQAVRDTAWDMMTDRIAQTVNPGALVSAYDLRRAHAYLIRTLIAETGGKDWDEYRKTMAQRFEEEFHSALGQTAIDTNQDGDVQSNEGWRRTISLERG